MANTDLTLPRQAQSDLHDMVDEMGEKVAKGTLVTLTVGNPTPLNDPSECTCKRLSELRDDGYIHYWYEADPNCKYIHLQPLPVPHKIKL